MPRYEAYGYRVEHYRIEGEFPDPTAAEASLMGAMDFPGWYAEHEHAAVLSLREVEPDCS